jgi:hypothetical protein
MVEIPRLQTKILFAIVLTTLSLLPPPPPPIPSPIEGGGGLRLATRITPLVTPPTIPPLT